MTDTHTPVGRATACALALLIVFTTFSFAQVTTAGRLTGTISDGAGAVIPDAVVAVKGARAEGRYTATADKEGNWTLPSIPAGIYSVAVTAKGFKSSVVQNVKVDVGLPATVNVQLEVGEISEQVVVTGGGEIMQTASATVGATITGRKIQELPFSTREGMQLILTLPGVMTPGTWRTSSVNGLPKSALNITIDGANVQSLQNRSGDGFFTEIQAKSDAVEEVSVSTAAPGAESAGGGAVQIRFVTRQGSNDFRGALFWQHRNSALNANYYFNNIDRLPRERILLNQFGGNLGGPIRIPKLFNGRDRAFFFVNVEEFRLPQSYLATRTVLTPEAAQGLFRYRDSAGVVRDVNLYQIAAARGFTSTVDPMTARALGLIGEAAARGQLTSRIGTGNDYNRLDLVFQEAGINRRHFPTVRLDVDLTTKHHLEFIHNYQNYFANPDGTNGILSAYPGTGSILGGDGSTGSVYRNSFSFVLAERWTIGVNLVNEVRFTASGNGIANFRREFSPDNYRLFNGVAVFVPYISGYNTYTSNTRDHSPSRTLTNNLTWLRGAHTINLGGSYARIRSYEEAVSTALVPSATLGIAAGDPVNTGTTSIFTTANFPNSTAQQRSDAANLYAVLTGRIASTTRTAALDEKTRRFALAPTIERNHFYEVGLYAQDSWKVSPALTLTGGLRWEFDPSPVNDNGVYTRTGPDGVFGVSGFGNLFNPGVYRAGLTQYRLVAPGEKAFRNNYKDFAPSLGFAWSPRVRNGLLSRLLGASSQTVLRGGYSIAYVREGFEAFNSMFGANEGVSVALGTNPASFPTEFGPAGSRQLRDATLPFLPIPDAVFPFTARQGASPNDFDPNLRPGYAQSWSFGIQRELTKDMALEVRYVGNHGTRLWRQYEIGEVNIFENGFLDEFKAAQRNQAICQANATACVAAQSSLPAASRTANSYGNWGLPGQSAVPIMQTALGAVDLNTIVFLTRGEAGRVAASIAQNLTRMNALISNPVTAALVKPITTTDPNNPGQSVTLSNFFVANPRSPTQSYLMDNAADSNYHALQAELRRRLSRGLLLQGNYVWAKSLSNLFANSNAAFSTPTTLRNPNRDKSVGPRDIRHAFKIDGIYELPVGPGRRWFAGGPAFVRKALEGWQLGGIARIQSGAPTLITSGRQTFNNRDAGIVLHNITRNELQKLVRIRKETVCDPACRGVVYFLPQSIIDNTLAAFEQGGKTPADLDRSRPYIGPPTTPGELGSILYLYGPWSSRFDFNLLKRTRVTEKSSLEFRVQFLNAFNQSGLLIRGVTIDASTSGVNSSFGQTRSAYRDFSPSGTNDPGGRLIEFQLRFNF